MPKARNSPGFLRGEMRVLTEARRNRRRRMAKAKLLLSRLRKRLDKRWAGRDRFLAWEIKQSTIPPHEKPANAWSLWGKPHQIKQRLVHLGRLPKRHEKTPITMWTASGIGQKHAAARLTAYARARSAQIKRIDEIEARIGSK